MAALSIYCPNVSRMKETASKITDGQHAYIVFGVECALHHTPDYFLRQVGRVISRVAFQHTFHETGLSDLTRPKGIFRFG